MAQIDHRVTEPGRHDSNAVKSPVDARQGRKFGRMRYVLIFGVALAILAMLLVYAGVFSSPPAQP
ncbi:hypothetical protein [Geminicoccus harenae]|uniref:hypothetical protein n=1 Tax=Geminicoccus harenae TaxID=2498453 RepID=UPI00168A9725|nr:hypothetical protein [Geminicoccus harenae]